MRSSVPGLGGSALGAILEIHVLSMVEIASFGRVQDGHGFSGVLLLSGVCRKPCLAPSLVATPLACIHGWRGCFQSWFRYKLEDVSS